MSICNKYQLRFVIGEGRFQVFETMAALDPQCCHFALAKSLAEKKMPCGVNARDKLLMDTIEAKQVEIFDEKEGRLAETDKEKKILRAVLKSVRTEVENCKQGCDLHGFCRLEIVRKSSGIIGGIFRIEDALFSFLVDKKTKKKNQVALTVEKVEKGTGNTCKLYPTLCSLFDANLQGANHFCFTFPLRCAGCRGGDKEARLEDFQKYFKTKQLLNQDVGSALEVEHLPDLLVLNFLS